MNNYVIWLILSIITGLMCYFIARKKGRSTFLWFLAWVVFNVLALAAMMGVKNLRNQRVKNQKGG